MATMVLVECKDIHGELNCWDVEFCLRWDAIPWHWRLGTATIVRRMVYSRDKSLGVPWDSTLDKWLDPETIEWLDSLDEQTRQECLTGIADACTTAAQHAQTLYLQTKE